MLPIKNQQLAEADNSVNTTHLDENPMDRTANLATQYARGAARLGWRLIPLRLNDKRPSWSGWPEKATSDIDKIMSWWDLEPERGYGIVTGMNSCIVLDIDVKNNQQGMESLRQIFSEEELASFVTVKTPSGGLHIYYRSEQAIRNAQGFMPGLDIRGDGGYIIGPGTSVDGKSYQLVNGSFDQITEIPDKLVAAIKASRQQKAEKVKQVLAYDQSVQISEGCRNETLFQLACSMRDECLTKAQAYERLLEINEYQCDPPMDEKDIEIIITSAYSREPDLVSFLDRFPLNEKGASEVLLHFHCEDMIYVPEFKEYAFWNNHLWEFDNNLQAERHAKLVTELYEKAHGQILERIHKADAEGDVDSCKQLKSKAGLYARMQTKTGSYSGMRNILDIAKSEIVVNQCRLDADDFMFATINGVVNLNIGEFSATASCTDYMTMRGLVEFDPDARCPEWEKFVSEAMLGDQVMVDYLQQVAGYMLSGSTREQALFFLYGVGANGKSTFMNVLQRLMGDYQVALPSSSLMARAGSGANASPDLAMLRGKRLAVASELEENERFNESLVKSLTGGDTLSVRKLYGDFFQLDPRFKLFVIGNHKPYIRGTDDGIWRRFHLIPFRNQVPREQQDRHLEARLMAELPGILNWAIEGCLKWQQSDRGLDMPDLVKQETQGYRKSEDLLERFMSDCCRAEPQTGEYQKYLYDAYKDWAAENHEFVMSNRKFGEKLREHGFQKIDRSGGNYWAGLCLGGANTQDDKAVEAMEYTI